MTTWEQERIAWLEAENARLNAKIISAILPALKDSTLAVKDALVLLRAIEAEKEASVAKRTKAATQEANNIATKQANELVTKTLDDYSEADDSPSEASSSETGSTHRPKD